MTQPSEPEATWAAPVQRWPRTIAAPLVAIDLALVGGLVVEGSVLAHRGGARYVLTPLAALLLYATAIATVHPGVRPWLPMALRLGAIAGLLTGVMWIASLTVETFGDLSGWPNIVATAPLLLGAFAVWAVASAIASKRTESLAAGVVAAVSAAMLCVTITIGFGLALAYLALPTLEHNINGSPEFLGSHWGDLHAFAIANTLDAAFQHLLIAPIIAALTGSLGALVAGRRTRPG